MIFSSITFLLMFLPAMLAAYFLFRGRPVRNVLLVVASFFFYAWGAPKALIPLWGSIALNYLLGLAIDHWRGRPVWSRSVLTVGVLGNIALLGYFKYTDFFVSTVNRIGGLDIPLPDILLPAGVSFFTFLGLSYLFDVYRQRGPVLKNPVNLAMYQGQFMTVLAGPITRYQHYAGQIFKREESLENLAYGIERFIIGLAKKLIIAGGLAAIPVLTKDTMHTSTTATAWISALAYTGVIYFDFSGYSDMAIGLGRMFGFKISENFDYPYVSKSIGEFWRRWHITMGAWFREYVYIPLGGGRRASGRVIGNLLAVWVLTGLWHGSAWTFVVWGLYYFVLIVIEKYVLRHRLERIWAPLRHLVVMVLVVVGWVIFNAPSLSLALAQLKLMVGVGGAGAADSTSLHYLSEYRFEIILAVLGSMPTVPYLKRLLAGTDKYPWVRQGRLFVKPLVLGVLLVISISYAVSASFLPFIYFKF